MKIEIEDELIALLNQLELPSTFNLISDFIEIGNPNNIFLTVRAITEDDEESSFYMSIESFEQEIIRDLKVHPDLILDFPQSLIDYLLSRKIISVSYISYSLCF
jgi:hypothetical protein